MGRLQILLRLIAFFFLPVLLIFPLLLQTWLSFFALLFIDIVAIIIYMKYFGEKGLEEKQKRKDSAPSGAVDSGFVRISGNCPNCLKKISSFSSKCPYCTNDFY